MNKSTLPELAALPVELVELVVRNSDKHNTRVFAGRDMDWTVSVDNNYCARHGIDPAALARFITTFTFLPRLMELMFDENGKWKTFNYVQIEECTTLARRYHAAMKGGAA